MAFNFSIGYKSSITSRNLNEKFHALVGENRVLTGFKITAEGINNNIALEPGLAFIGGCMISEDTGTVSTLVPSNPNLEPKVYNVYLRYSHSENDKSECSLRAALENEALTENDLLLAKVTRYANAPHVLEKDIEHVDSSVMTMTELSELVAQLQDDVAQIISDYVSGDMFHFGVVAPQDTRKLWVDSSDNSFKLRFHDGSAWQYASGEDSQKFGGLTPDEFRVSVNKADVELDKVENYPVATSVEAGVAKSNQRYMTPLRTREEILAVASPFSVAISGDGRNYSIFAKPDISTIEAGAKYTMKINLTNSGPVSLKVTHGGDITPSVDFAAPLTGQDGLPLVAGRIKNGRIYEIIYNGVNFQVLNDVTADAIPQTPSMRFVSDEEKTAWNSKAEGEHTHVHDDITDFPVLGTAAAKNVGTLEGDIPVLGTDGKLDTSFIPQISVGGEVHVVDTEAEMLALVADAGDFCVINGVGTYILSVLPASTLENWKEIATPGVTSVTKSDVGLGNVINVEQAAKTDFDNHTGNTGIHITSAERTAWNAKAGTAVATISASGLMSSGDKTKLDSVAIGANNYTHPGSGTNPHGTTASDVGLGSVSNYGVATTLEAQTGTSTSKYMTPSNTFSAIDARLINIPNVKVTGTSKAAGYFYAGTTAPTNTTRLNYDGYLYTTRLYGAVYNDYAECRQAKIMLEPGSVVCDVGNGYIAPSNKRLAKVPMIISDTYGFSIGEQNIEGEYSLPVAVAGRALVFVDKDKNAFKVGDVVCATSGGKASKMKWWEKILFPDRILGVVSEIPYYNSWGTGNVDVGNRIWIKI